MNITVTGMGYVGLVTAACLAEIGHTVTCYDTDNNKINFLLMGEVEIYEPGLPELLKKNMKQQRLSFTKEPTVAYQNPDCIFLTVGTPGNHKGDVDFISLNNAIQTLIESIQSSTIVAIKSTVPVGTCDKLQNMFNVHLPKDITVKVVSNPEFLREGSGIDDTLKADRIIVGTEEESVKEFFHYLYQPLNTPIVYTDVKSSEMIKYAANSFLATKISFINEIANLCELTGANIDQVAYGIGLDHRIGTSFLQAGIGYGGSCFTKDTVAFDHFSDEHGYSFELLKATIKVNERQKQWFFRKLSKIFSKLNGLKIAVLGLSFKPFTDDIRGATSITIIELLEKMGAKVTVYDPVASNNFLKVFPKIDVANSIDEAIKEKEVVLIMTDWPDIKNFELQKYKAFMEKPVILDGRNCYRLAEVEQEKVTYYSVGRRTINPIQFE